MTSPSGGAPASIGLAQRERALSPAATAAALGLFVLVLAAAGVFQGQTNNWDLRNYHLYSPWAWLGERLSRDAAPAQMQSYVNPLLHVPILLAALYLPAVAFTFALAAVQALNIVPLYLIARRVLAPRVGARRSWVPWLAALTGATGATQLGELGTTFTDTLVTLPLLVGLALLLPPRSRLGEASAGASWRRPRVWGGGFLVGAAAGFKLVVAPFAAGAILGVLAACGRLGSRLRVTLVAGGASLAGLLLTAGPWMLESWERFRNPLFPFLPSLFPGTPDAPPMGDPRFGPLSLLSGLLYPFALLRDPHLGSEVAFRDLRLPLLLAVAVVTPWWRGRPRRGAASHLAVCAAVGYLGWLLLSGYYRYLAPLEMLAPVLIFVAVDQALPARKARDAAVLALTALCIGTTSPPDWGRIPHRRHVLEVAPIQLPARSLVLFAGPRPLAFLALALGPEHDYLRASGNFNGPLVPPWALDWQVARSLDDVRHRPAVAVFQGPPESVTTDYRRFGLVLDPSSCRPIWSNVTAPDPHPVTICALRRAASAIKAIAADRASWLRRCEGAPPSHPECRRVRAWRQSWGNAQSGRPPRPMAPRLEDERVQRAGWSPRHDPTVMGFGGARARRSGQGQRSPSSQRVREPLSKARQRPRPHLHARQCEQR